jgi:hypothetical protein
MLFEERIAEHLLQAVGKTRLVVVGECLQLDVKDLGELDQQVRRQRTLIVLDEIEVTRRDAELLGELRLRELFTPAHAPDLRAESGTVFGLYGHGSLLRDLHRLTALQPHFYI